MKLQLPELTPEAEQRITVLRSQRGWEMLKRYTQSQSRAQNPKIKSAFKCVLSSAKDGSLFFLLGKMGAGKTQLAADIMVAYTRHLLSAEYTTAMRFFLEIKATYGCKDSANTELMVLNSFCKPQLLVIDEFEKRSENRWANELLYELVNDRYSMNKDTLLLSNCNEAEFAKLVGPFIVSRMQETGATFVMDWKSFRS